ncbi:MAG: [FeFe] hydrogenase H-cluster maturation GTPase HydF [Campylobacteraceae bacterium]|nr:[FeFe] hydrogenase H-cluster maturation GTPase HydF [Campylobacteraceae bacterium]
MNKTPNSLRFTIGIFGSTNAGKSTLLNALVGESVSITSSVKGTTTDSVKKAYELEGVGAVLFIDTAGLDDESELGKERVKKAVTEIDRVDLAIVVLKNEALNEQETTLVKKLKEKQIETLFVINKFDESLVNLSLENSVSLNLLKDSVDEIYTHIKKIFDKKSEKREIFDGVLGENELVVLITPIDEAAPKGRMILPQTQALRDILDKKSHAFVSQNTNIDELLANFSKKPNLIVADSQYIQEVVKTSPKELKITTFSILMARLKGDLKGLVDGANMLDRLKENDKILIAEACSHRYVEGDIARTKIPKLLEKYLGFKPNLTYTCGKEFGDIDEFSLIIHCGGCMLNRKTMLNRQQTAKNKNIAITNYGVLISKTQGVLDRVIEIFDEL